MAQSMTERVAAAERDITRAGARRDRAAEALRAAEAEYLAVCRAAVETVPVGVVVEISGIPEKLLLPAKRPQARATPPEQREEVIRPVIA